MSNKQWKPWEWYPHIWKTEASFWSYLRGGLRRGLWEKSPVKLDFKNKIVEKPPEGYTGRAKSGKECALTGVWTGKSKGEIDHKEGHKSLLSEEDILEFIKHLVPHPDNMQFVDKEAHKIKSHAERKGISFEEAEIEKKVIKIINDKLDKQFFEERGLDIPSNAKKRREAITDILNKELKEEKFNE